MALNLSQKNRRHPGAGRDPLSPMVVESVDDILRSVNGTSMYHYSGLHRMTNSVTEQEFLLKYVPFRSDSHILYRQKNGR